MCVGVGVGHRVPTMGCLLGRGWVFVVTVVVPSMHVVKKIRIIRFFEGY